MLIFIRVCAHGLEEQREKYFDAIVISFCILGDFFTAFLYAWVASSDISESDLFACLYIFCLAVVVLCENKGFHTYYLPCFAFLFSVKNVF